jgi:hypothetical protein
MRWFAVPGDGRHFSLYRYYVIKYNKNVSDSFPTETALGDVVYWLQL